MTEGRLPRPRDWIGAATYPWPPVHSLSGGAAVVACFAVAGFQLGRTRQDKSYLKLQLGDRHGTIEGRVWDDAEQFAAWLRPGLCVGVRGHLEIFNGERQLRVDTLAPLRVGLEELELFVPRSKRDPRVMEEELRRLVDSIADAPLRALVERLLGKDSEIGRGFRLAPAAKQNHHAYLGGLIEHTLSVAHVCDDLARHYDAGIDRDLLIAAALLHDVGKVREIGAQAGFPYTDEGKLLGHILLGLQMVANAAAGVPGLHADRLLLLQHLIASHQGRYEWQSPREPRILEGLLLHYADDLDAKAHQATALIDGVQAGWTAYDRSFGRDFLRHRIADADTGETPEGDVPNGEHNGNRPEPAEHDVAAGERTPAEHTLDLFGGPAIEAPG
ncbi:MAG: 3'-5' exoribonuclease YhaM family protein [Longimicrobiales bacterium]